MYGLRWLYRFEGMEELVSSTNFLHVAGMPPMGWNEYKQFSNIFASAFHRFVRNIDMVAVRFNITATYKGEFQGLPPTGKKVSVSTMDFLTIVFHQAYSKI